RRMEGASASAEGTPAGCGGPRALPLGGQTSEARVHFPLGRLVPRSDVRWSPEGVESEGGLEQRRARSPGAGTPLAEIRGWRCSRGRPAADGSLGSPKIRREAQSSTLRILYLNPIGQLGGAERSLIDLLRSLHDHDRSLELSVLSLAEGPLNDAVRDL